MLPEAVEGASVWRDEVRRLGAVASLAADGASLPAAAEGTSPWRVEGRRLVGGASGPLGADADPEGALRVPERRLPLGSSMPFDEWNSCRRVNIKIIVQRFIFVRENV